MVRTKQPRKTRSIRETTEESDSLVKDFERQTAQKVHKVEADFSMQISMIANSTDVALAGLPTDIRKLTMAEFLALDAINENDAVLETTDDVSTDVSSVSRTNVARAKKAPKRGTAASDDGYATESTTNVRTTRVSRINETKNSSERQTRKHRSSSNGGISEKRVTRTTRSASRGRNSKFIADNERERGKDLLKSTGRCPPSGFKYKTPATKNTSSYFNVVTPKIKPNMPMNVMRRPRQGEMVLSMQGSPLLVSSIVQERTANINVPLQNGDVISLLPNPGLRLSHMPEVDDETMQQLRTLNGHLNKVMGKK